MAGDSDGARRRHTSCVHERMHHAARFALTAFVAACAPLPVHQGTDTTPKGQVQVSGSVGGVLYRDVVQGASTPAADAQLGARYGIGDDVDVGGKVSVLGLDVGLKWRVLRGAVPVAIAPSLGGARYPATSGLPVSAQAWGRLPVIVGHRLSESVALHAGPTSLYGLFAPRGGGVSQGLAIGAFANVELEVARGARMLPEVAVYRSVLRDLPVNGWTLFFGPAFVFDEP